MGGSRNEHPLAVASSSEDALSIEKGRIHSSSLPNLCRKVSRADHLPVHHSSSPSLAASFLHLPRPPPSHLLPPASPTTRGVRRSRRVSHLQVPSLDLVSFPSLQLQSLCCRKRASSPPFTTHSLSLSLLQGARRSLQSSRLPPSRETVPHDEERALLETSRQSGLYRR